MAITCCSHRPFVRGSVIAIFAIVGGYYLWMQHRAHVPQYWPLGIFLLCPLVHIFGGHHDHSSHPNQTLKDGDPK